MKTLQSTLSAAAFALAFSATIHTASAQMVTIPNPSFENPSSSSDQISTAQTNTVITGWTLFSSTPGSAFTGTAAYGAGSQYDGISNGTGSQGALLNPIFGYHAESLTSNSAVTTVAASTTYTLSADVGVPSGSNNGAGNPDHDTFTLSLVEGDGTVFASQVYDESLFSVGSLSPLTLTYTSSSAPSDLGQGLQIQFFLQNSQDDSHSAIVIDNVSLSASSSSVPEPSTYAMLAAGFGALVFASRFRKLA